MMDIRIDNGVKTYTINGCEVRFNPTDMFFAGNVAKAIEGISDVYDRYNQERLGVNKLSDLFDLDMKYDAETRALIDGVMGAPVCDAVTGDINIFAMSDGVPLAALILIHVWGEIDDGITAETKKQNPKLQALLKKYRKA